MAQWQQIRLLDSACREQVHNLYSDDCLPMEVREYLAYWIEEQDWNKAVQSDCSQAYLLFQTMLALLDNELGRFTWQAESDSNMVIRHNLRRSKLSLQSMYGERPNELANMIDGLLREEKAILAAATATSPTSLEPRPDVALITGHENNIEDRLAEMRRAIQGIKNSIEQLEDLQGTFNFRYTTYGILKHSMPSDPSLNHKLNELQTMVNQLDSYRKAVLARIQELLGRSDTLRDLLLSELSTWHDRQRRTCIGDVCDTSLQQLEKWCTGSAEDLFHLLWLLQTLKDQHEKMTYPSDPLPVHLPQLEQRLKEQIVCLLKSAFVVEIQPKMPHPSRRPLLLKTNSKFSVRVRLLVKLMDQEHKMEVKIEVNRDSANLVGFRRFNVFPSNTKTMVKNGPQMEGLICDFSHIMLREQKIGGSGKGRGANEGSLPVTEELHVITFTLNYCYQGLTCQLQTSTLPVVIISNPNQASSAWASILWFNMVGADPKKQLFFSSPSAATWAQLSRVLSWQFLRATQRGLDAEQLKMLGEKLCGPKVTLQSTITWTQFCKDSPAGENFSFWTWLDEILSLIEEHLLELWKNNLIMGFVSRKRERHLLKKKRLGTFLLRFSETTRGGGITCTWVEYNDDGSPKFHSVMPYTKAELKLLALPDIIHDYQLLAEEDIPENPLLYLYPDTPRNEAFGRYYRERREGDLVEQKKYLSRRLIRVSSRHQEEPHLPQMYPEEPLLPPGNPEEPLLPPGNSEEPLLLPGNPEEPLLPPWNPEEPLLLPGNPEEPLLPPVNPEEPHLLPGNLEEPCLLPEYSGFSNDNLDVISHLLGNVMLRMNDPFLPQPLKEEQLQSFELFGLPDEMPVLKLDEADF